LHLIFIFVVNNLGMDVAHCYIDGNADCVEFCPHDAYHHVLAASTYMLQEGDQPSRSGSISLFNVDANKGCLDLFHRVDTAGIFDLKWSPVGGNVGCLLAQADADGCLRFHSLESCLDGAKGMFSTSTTYNLAVHLFLCFSESMEKVEGKCKKCSKMFMN
jgi:diphthamide biosynthesis protein 7